MNQDNLQSNDQHRQILLLLPWYLNQSLELAERQRVENHIHCCLLCRRELIYLKNLAAAVKQESDVDVAAEISFDKLREKLQTSRPNRLPPMLPAMPAVGGLEKRTGVNSRFSKRRHPFWAFIASNRAGLAIAATLLLAIIPFAMQTAPSPVGYYTLSDARLESSAGPKLRVVFKNSLSDADIDALLAEIHGYRLEGPNSVGAYTVRLGSDKNTPALATAVAFLRSQQNVMLAEPVLNQP